MQWTAEREGIPFRFPPAHPFNPIRVLRLAVACGSRRDAVQAIFRHIWREGHSVDDDAGLRALAATLGIADLDAATSAPSVKDELRANGDRAIAAGVFGVPSLVIDGEVIWGFDATGMAIEYLANPGRFASGELGRVAALPIGTERPR
mgnify:CR=1 FL=1